MYKIKIFSVHKTKEPWLQEALLEYEKRLSPQCTFEWVLPKQEEQLMHLIEKENFWIVLSPEAKEYTSEEFSLLLHKHLELGKSRLSFVIGGPSGIPYSIIDKALLKISLSKMTFTNQMARLLLVEQIYRAFEIHKGSHYHK